MKKITGNEPISPIMNNEGFVSSLDAILPTEGTYCTGLTIRQHFAGLAMQGFCSAGYGDFNKDHEKLIAELSVAQADALIAELNK